jgi:hypothetical protein
VLESSTNGIDFSPLLTDVTGVKNYNNQPSKKGNIYYRLKATSVIAEIMYSNIVVLNANGDDKLFNVSTLVQQSIYVTASENYNYKIYDSNARLITSGRQKQGIGTIDASNFSKGLYILQMISNDNIQTERIIKQ